MFQSLFYSRSFSRGNAEGNSPPFFLSDNPPLRLILFGGCPLLMTYYFHLVYLALVKAADASECMPLHAMR